jgi:hypothetical protein
MTIPLSGPSDLGMRKDLIRMRMEMHRQEVVYHAEPLRRPAMLVKSLMTSRRQGSPARKTPLAIGGAVLLTLFGKRLGLLGKLARVALVVYPVIKGVKSEAAEAGHKPVR